MDRAEFRAALKRNSLSCDEFAAMTGRSLSQVYSWGEEYPVPYYARVLLRLLDERGGAQGLIGDEFDLRVPH